MDLADQAMALALLGDRKAAWRRCARALDAGLWSDKSPLQQEPTFAAMRGDAEFEAIVHKVDQKHCARTPGHGPDARGRSIAGT